MKRDFAVLNEDHIKTLSHWLTLSSRDQEESCPICDCDICRKLFPRCNNGDKNCPCTEYTEKFLIGVARRAIEYLKERYK